MNKILLSITALIVLTFNTNAQYCLPTSTNLFTGHQIQYFQVGTFINITQNTPLLEYNDYSDSLIINVDIGTKYYLVMSKEANPWGPIAGNTLGYSIWIDFDDDTIFAPSEEVYSQYYGSGFYTYEDTLLFTDSSYVGSHRLRLRNEWGADPDLPCDALWGGETEDYTINFSLPVITEADKLQSNLNNALTIYPNPTSDYLNIISDAEVKFIQIVDVSGREISSQKNSSNTINVLELPKGIYFLLLTTNEGITSHKFVKQ